MPEIPQYTVETGRRAASAVAVRPTNIGEQAWQQAGRKIGELGNQAAGETERGFRSLDSGLTDLGTAATQHATLQEVSSQGPAFSNLLTNLSDQYEKANAAAAAGDQQAIPNFRDSMEDQLQNVAGQPQTPRAQEYAIVQANRVRSHFANAIVADSAKNAADKALTDLYGTVNTYANAAAANPTLLDTAISAYKTHVQQLVGEHNLNPQAADLLLTGRSDHGISQIVGSTIAAVTTGNPEKNQPSNPSGARQLIQQYSKYLTPEQQTTLLNHANYQDRLNASQARIDVNTGRQLDADAQAQAIDSVVADVFNSGGKVPPDAMSRLGQAALLPGSGTKSGLELLTSTQRWLNAVSKNPTGVRDPATYASMSQRLWLPEGDPNQLTLPQVFDAGAENKLTTADVKYFNSELAKRQSEEGSLDHDIMSNAMATIKNTLSNSLMQGTQAGVTQSLAVNRFTTWFMPQYQALRRAGKSAADAVNALITPENLTMHGGPLVGSPAGSNGSGMYAPAVPQAAPGSNTVPPKPGAAKDQPTGIFSGLFGR